MTAEQQGGEKAGPAREGVDFPTLAPLETPDFPAEQQGSDESGEGVRDDVRQRVVIALCAKQASVSIQTEDLRSLLTATVSAEAALATAQCEADGLRAERDALEAAYATAPSCEAQKTCRARRDADELQGRLAAVEAAFELVTGEMNAVAYLVLRAALANPSAAQGEGEA